MKEPAAPPELLTPEQWRALPRARYSGGNRVNLLKGGDELFPAMCRAIASARHEVWLATYIFHDDASARTVIEALVAAAKRGVLVRVVLDGFGSKASCAPIKQELEAAGVSMAIFRPMVGWRSWLQPIQLRRLHEKLCVVDGRVGFVGGINLIDDRFDLTHGHSDLPRLDFAVEAEGPVVDPIRQATRAVWTRARLARDFSDEMRAIAASNRPTEQLRGVLQRVSAPKGGVPLPVEGLPPVRAAFVQRDNFRRRRTIERAYISAIRSAEKRVDLVSPYFYPAQSFRRTLRQAARRGVKVRLLLQGKLDYKVAGLMARVLYAELLSSGVRIFEYTPAFLHAKVGVVDDDWATVGSSNIDPLSLLLNLEANLIVRDADFTADLAGAFEAAIAQSHEVTEAELPQRGLWPRLTRGVVAWCAHMYLRVAGATGRY